MRVTIEIELEEAARFLAGMADVQRKVFVEHSTNKIPWQVDWASDPTQWPTFWNEAASKWLDAIRDNHGTTREQQCLNGSQKHATEQNPPAKTGVTLSSGARDMITLKTMG